MKYMLIMRSTEEAKTVYEELDFEQVLNAMGAYNESMMKAGVLLAGEGLTDATEGFVVDFSAEKPIVTDGPYGETHELFNGFWIIEVSTREERSEERRVGKECRAGWGRDHEQETVRGGAGGGG